MNDRNRCPDCGQEGEIRGHFGCLYPVEIDDTNDRITDEQEKGRDTEEEI